MVNYRRFKIPGVQYFFTAVTKDRKHVFDNNVRVKSLKSAMNIAKQKYDFTIDAIVVLPDHLHCLMTTDEDYSLIWQSIKLQSSRIILDSISGTIWQPRYWEHVIRDEYDWKQHMHYIHYNPVKHGYVVSPSEYPYSSFHRYVEKGFYQVDWGCSEPNMTKHMEFE